LKKIAVTLAVAMLALGLLIVVVHRSGTIKGQTSSTPSASAPATSAPSSAVASTAPVVNRPVSRWLTTNQTLLNSLIDDSKKLQDYISNMQLDYAEATCVQMRCDINTMRGVPPPDTGDDMYYFPPGEPVVYLPVEAKGMVLNSPIPRNWLMWNRLSIQNYSSRELQGAPSGVECPPIPDAQAAADLNAGLAQLETAVDRMVNGVNDSNESYLLGLEAELKAANETLQKVLTDLGQQ
jgi:hypothetical protein